MLLTRQVQFYQGQKSAGQVVFPPQSNFSFKEVVKHQVLAILRF
jgi:hypothetical protein